MKINWTCRHFHELSTLELYKILKVRDEVFVVEQQCNYLDADDKDLACLHLCGWDGDTLAAYARIIPPGEAYETASIGRVLTMPEYRKAGLGKELMQLAIEKTFRLFDIHTIHIGAQLYLMKFYSELGFKPVGETYLEDNIPHIEMILHK